MRQSNELAKSIRRYQTRGCDFFIEPSGAFYDQHPSEYSHGNPDRKIMEVTKALAALQPLYNKGNIEIVTAEGIRVRGIVRSMKTTHALSTPSVKVERADGEIVKVPFNSIIEIINHNRPGRDA